MHRPFDTDSDATAAKPIRDEFDKLRRTLGPIEDPLPVVPALAHHEAEAWWLAGFVPTGKREITTHADVCKEFKGLDPVKRAHELKSASGSAKRKCKETFERLAGKPRSDRGLKCLEDPSLDTLTKHGAHSGLARYIDDVRAALCPALAAR